MPKFVPTSLTRLAGRTSLRLQKNSPTLLVLGGVAGLGVTAFMAARATRKLDPVLVNHRNERAQIGVVAKHDKVLRKEQQTRIVEVYYNTGFHLARIYGPTIAVGTLSAASVLWGHRILQGRHVATMMAYSGLQEQFLSYRGRVAKTLGSKAEEDIYNGAHGEWREDPEHKGEYKMQPVFEPDETQSYLRPWFDDTCNAWVNDPKSNYYTLKGLQAHANIRLQHFGFVFLNEILEDIGLPRCPEGAVTGWLWNKDDSGGDNYIDFGFMTSNDPSCVEFRAFETATPRLNFNIDGVIWDKIPSSS